MRLVQVTQRHIRFYHLSTSQPLFMTICCYMNSRVCNMYAYSNMCVCNPCMYAYKYYICVYVIWYCIYASSGKEERLCRLPSIINHTHTNTRMHMCAQYIHTPSINFFYQRGCFFCLAYSILRGKRPKK